MMPGTYEHVFLYWWWTRFSSRHLTTLWRKHGGTKLLVLFDKHITKYGNIILHISYIIILYISRGGQGFPAAPWPLCGANMGRRKANTRRRRLSLTQHSPIENNPLDRLATVTVVHLHLMRAHLSCDSLPTSTAWAWQLSAYLRLATASNHRGFFQQYEALWQRVKWNPTLDPLFVAIHRNDGETNLVLLWHHRSSLVSTLIVVRFCYSRILALC